MQDYRKLHVWQKAHRLALDVYAISAYLKAPEAWPFGIRSFARLSLCPSNIAEGSGRGSKADFGRFLWHSMGSCNELEYDLLLARDLNFLPRSSHTALGEQVQEVRRMLTGLIQSIKLDPRSDSNR